MNTLKPAIDIKELNQHYCQSVVPICTRAERIYHRYIKAKGGIPYALRFKAWCKRYGIEL